MTNDTLTPSSDVGGGPISTADAIIGVVYTLMGLFGIFENSLTAYLMATDSHMRNPTYYYMINLGIADAIILFPIALYAGLSLLWPVLRAHVLVRGFGAWLTAIGWYPGCLFMVLASASRYVQLAMPHNVPVLFSRRSLIVSISMAWSIPTILYTWFIYWDPIPLDFLADRYTWAFHWAQPMARALSITNITVNGIFALLLVVFNLMSLLCVRRIRRQVTTIETSGNLKREIKLFAQCAITGAIYTLAVVYFFIMSALEDSLVWWQFLTTHILWTCNHIQNPMIYFVLNNRLRQRILNLLCPSKFAKFHSTTGAQQSQQQQQHQRQSSTASAAKGSSTIET